MVDFFEALPPELVTHVMSKANPRAVVQMSGVCTNFAQLGSSDELWRDICDAHAIPRLNRARSWLDVYRQALTCPHVRGSRKLRYDATYSPEAELYFASGDHPPMHTCAVCDDCGCSLRIDVMAHKDQNAGSLRMSKVTFTCSTSAKPWTELWYGSGNGLFSLKGGEGQELATAPTCVYFETSADAFAGLRKC